MIDLVIYGISFALIMLNCILLRVSLLLII